jgi:phosphatidylserine/phosphatidylglycerophosphate/cardiolipin synthase-like enzyme
MGKVKLIKSPWEDTFLNIMKPAKRRIFLACPFIKQQTANIIIENVNKNLEIKYIHSFKLANFHRGVSDVEALKIFHNHKVQQKNVHNLHAKFFIFDNKAVITSANLTPGGLRNNLEYGVLLEGSLVNDIANDYLTIFNNNEYPFISLEILEEVEKILQSIPKEKSKKELKLSDKKLFSEILNDENIDEQFDGGIDLILGNLSSWKRDVFECLLKIDNDIFYLEEVYQFEDYLKNLHPENRNVKPKIRQQLQYLRDLGLLEFIKPGVYKKLWKQ